MAELRKQEVEDIITRAVRSIGQQLQDLKSMHQRLSDRPENKFQGGTMEQKTISLENKVDNLKQQLDTLDIRIREIDRMLRQTADTTKQQSVMINKIPQAEDANRRTGMRRYFGL
jgi:hypothetical protein